LTLRLGSKARWSVLTWVIVLVAVALVVGGLFALNGSKLSVVAGWAAVADVLVSVVVGLPTLLEKLQTRSNADAVSIEQEKLAKAVKYQVEKELRPLIGGNIAGEPAIDLTFTRVPKNRDCGGADAGGRAGIREYYLNLKEPRRLVISGDAGAGKTVLSLSLIYDLLKSDRDKEAPVPVRVDVASYDDRPRWNEWLAGYLALQYRVDKYLADSLIGQGGILPIIDGLDEMDPPGETTRALALVDELNKEWPSVVLTCRSGYENVMDRIDLATRVKVNQLTGVQEATYLKSHIRNNDHIERWNRLLSELGRRPDGKSAVEFSTPWRLTLVRTAVSDGVQPDQLLPGAADKGANYEEYVNELLLGHYISGAVKLYEPGRHKNSHRVEQWLISIAGKLNRQSLPNQSTTGIRLDTWWRTGGQWAMRILHVALAAVPALPWLLAGPSVTNMPFEIGIVLLAVAAFAALNPRPRWLSLREIATSLGALRLAAGLLCGLVIGASFVFVELRTFTFSSARLPVNGIPASVAFTLLLFGLVVGVVMSAAGTYSPRAVGPRDMVRQDGIAGLVLGFAVGIIIIILNISTAYVVVAPPLNRFGYNGPWFFHLNDLITIQSQNIRPFANFMMLSSGAQAGVVRGGVFIGCSFGLTVALALGGGAWVRYHIAAAVNAARRQEPLRFGAFLDWARKAQILRASGVAYQFRHRELQDWLTKKQVSE